MENNAEFKDVIQNVRFHLVSISTIMHEMNSINTTISIRTKRISHCVKNNSPFMHSDVKQQLKLISEDQKKIRELSDKVDKLQSVLSFDLYQKIQ